MKNQHALKIYELMLTSRLMDDRMAKWMKQNKGGTFEMTAAGHEMIGAVLGQTLEPGKDWALPYYRDQPLAVSWGCEPKELLAGALARVTPHHSGARMMPLHYSHKQLRMPCQSSCVGSQFLHAVGVARSVQLAKKKEVVYVSGGDGSTSQGDFHEALNFSCIYHLPVIFVIHDNGWAISVPVHEQTAGGSIVPKLRGYPGLHVFDVDGTDYEEMSKVSKEAAELARNGQGPCAIRARVPRLGPHSNSDDQRKYKPQELIAQEKEKDPLFKMEAYLLAHGLSEKELQKSKEKVIKAVEEASKEAEEYPYPDPVTVQDYVFAPAPDFDPQDLELKTISDEKIVIVDAVNRALQEEMQKDPSILVFGQDVAHGKGGVFCVTSHLTKNFGNERCFNTPLAESTIIGMATGMAMAGYHKPVAEVQFADYIWTGINQLFNEMSSIYYRSNGEWNCPAILRMPYGGYIQGGPYHSQSIEAYLAHCPGIKIVIPSNAADAKGLFKASLDDPNPVVFLEHKGLYRQQAFSGRAEPTANYRIPLGKANVVKEGEHLTFVGWGMMVVMGHEIATRLAKEGISVEVIDLRTIIPLDIETIFKSVKKTGKLLIAHEAAKTCGFGAEIAARCSEQLFEHLDAPIVRVGGLDTPVSYSKILETATLPQTPRIEEAIRALYAY